MHTCVLGRCCCPHCPLCLQLQLTSHSGPFRMYIARKMCGMRACVLSKTCVLFTSLFLLWLSPIFARTAYRQKGKDCTANKRENGYWRTNFCAEHRVPSAFKPVWQLIARAECLFVHFALVRWQLSHFPHIYIPICLPRYALSLCT